MTKNAESGASTQQIRSLTEDIAEVAKVPGGIEMLMTVAGEGLGGDAQQLRLYNRGGEVEGGLHEALRQGGRGDDEVLLHVSPEEYEAIVSMWGEPDINPNTGLPEYGFLSKLWKGVKKVVKKIVKSPIFSVVAPVALNFLVPGLGGAIGGALGATGKTASLIGNTLMRSGIGALGGGKQGALAGAVSGLTMGGAGAKLGSKLGMKGALGKYAGDALIGGAGNVAGGGDFMPGALGQVTNTMFQPRIEEGMENFMGSIFGEPGPALTGGGGKEAVPGGIFKSAIPSVDEVPLGEFPASMASGPTSVFGTPLPSPVAEDPSFLSKIGDWVKENPWMAAAGAGLLASNISTRNDDDPGPPGLPSQFTESLPQFAFDRQFQSLDPEAYYTYGQTGAAQSGEHQFLAPNTIGGPADLVTPQIRPNPDPRRYSHGALRRGYQEGGYVGYARGGGSGRDDTIEALLSDGEFVMDAETVALLGDGSNNEGARRLEELRENLRKHKGSGLAKGKFSPNAKRPEEYLKKTLGAQYTEKEGRKLRKRRLRRRTGAQHTEREGKRFLKELQDKYGEK